LKERKEKKIGVSIALKKIAQEVEENAPFETYRAVTRCFF